MFKEAKVILKLNKGIKTNKSVLTSDDAVDILSDAMKTLDREQVIVVPLTENNNPMCYHIISIGCLNCAPVSIGNIMKIVLLSNCRKFIVFHNHPSGSLEPSSADWELTKKVVKAADLIDLKLVDHIIVAGYTGNHVSLRSLDPTVFKKQVSQYED